MLICPVCKKQMSKSAGAYVCPEKHSYDISRRGYVNLLQSQSPKNHGDDKLMAAARREFLNCGFYSRLRECICSNIKGSCVADICCGEGYYLEGVCQRLSACSNGGSTCGIDISKAAVDAACRRSYAVQTSLAVANCTALPIADNVVSTALSVFAPISEAEVYRVLANDGILIRVVPGRDHLIELKRAVYDNAQLNPAFDNTLAGFELRGAENLRYTMRLDSPRIRSLFTMTPYFYRTSDKDRQKLKKLSELEVTAHFYIFVYNKKPSSPLR